MQVGFATNIPAASSPQVRANRETTRPAGAHRSSAPIRRAGPAPGVASQHALEQRSRERALDAKIAEVSDLSIRSHALGLTRHACPRTI
jgi:hypothetical protein